MEKIVMDSVLAYSCGVKVQTVVGGIDAIITGITIRFGIVCYELTYFDGMQHKEIWVNEVMFTTKEKKLTKIGYK